MRSVPSLTGATAAVTAEVGIMRAWSHVQSGIRSLDRQHWFWATIIGLVVIAITSVIDFGHLSNPSKIGWGVNLALMLVVAWLILPGMAIADRLPVTGPGPPVLRYMIVVVVVATLAGFAFPRLQNDLVSALLILFNQEPPGEDRSLVFSIWTAVNAFLFGGLATFVWVRLRGARRAECALADAQLAAAVASRNVVTTRLQAAQAQVDPQLLFEVLDHAEALYESDRTAATVLIDDLIAYLRAAMPGIHDTSSTVAQEIDLVRSYLALVKVRHENCLSYTIDLVEEVGDARLPPMMLLPLIDYAVKHGLERAKAQGRIHIATEALQSNRRGTSWAILPLG